MGRIRIESRVVHAAWRSAVPDLARRVRRAVKATLAVASPLPEGRAVELALLFTDDEKMRALNRDWRGKDKPTNVLAFAAQEAADGARLSPAPGHGTLLLGDVVLAYETVAREAGAGGLPLRDHLSHLIVHGVLHLLGYDHQRLREARIMEALEARALASLGIADPYEAPPRAARATRAGRAMER